MNPYDPTELLLLCDSILEDAEISGHEVYQLAQWLNEHREACYHWPGSILVKPLQDVWADGKINKTELRQIGRLLIRVRKEWGRQQAEQAEEQAAEFVEQLCDRFDLSQPLMPCIPYGTRIRSHSDPHVFYDVDLGGPSCSCPDWRSQRALLPPSHLSRCCKHILQAYGNIEPTTGWPGWLGAFIEAGYPAHLRTRWMILDINGRVVLASTAPQVWANVFAEDGGEYDRFGYNVVERRWSYGLKPYGAERIARAIHNASGR